MGKSCPYLDTLPDQAGIISKSNMSGDLQGIENYKYMCKHLGLSF